MENGAQIYDLKECSCLYSQQIRYESASRLLKKLDKMPLMYSLSVDNTAYYSSLNMDLHEDNREKKHRQTGESIDNLAQRVREKKICPHKIGMRCFHRGVADEVMKMQKDFSDMHFMRTGDFTVEISERSVSKGKALKLIADQLHICPRQIAAIGDSGSDLSMLRYAGLSFAVANASKSISHTADCCTSSNEEDGAAAAINNILQTDCSHGQARGVLIIKCSL